MKKTGTLLCPLPLLSKYIPLLLSPNPEIQKPSTHLQHTGSFYPPPPHLRVYFRILLIRFLTDDELALLVESGGVSLVLGGEGR